MTFVDLTKAFDSVSRNGLWKILAKFGCPEKFVKIISFFHDGMVARVLNDGGSSEPFQVTNGVKQGVKQSTPKNPYHEPHISVKEERLKAVANFT